MAEAKVEVKVVPSSSCEVNSMKKSSHPRLKTLSEPKLSKATWWTSFDYLTWGNQEHLWPISEAAFSAVPSTRVGELAMPKKHHSLSDTHIPHFLYGCGRPSQIWTVSDSALRAYPSKRLKQLSRHKSAPPAFLDQHIPQYVYSCGRSSGIWGIKRNALTCPARPRTASLARPKQFHPDYMPAKPVESIVSNGAKLYEITPNLDGLAKPKRSVEGPFRDAQWTVSKAAKEATASERLLELSKSKKLPDGFVPNRDEIWKIGVGALNAVTSNRIEELAKPIVRDTMDHVQFNPDVFNVSKAAMKAKATSRIEELAEPTRR